MANKVESRKAAKTAPTISRPGKKPVSLPSPAGLPGKRAENVAYRGAVPVKSFIGWVVLVLVSAVVVGFLAAQMLVNQRLGQLVNETSTRVELQAQGRSGVVGEWMRGLERTGDTVAGAEVVRIYMHETGLPVSGTVTDPKLAEAMRAQQPYMARVVKEFVEKNKLLGAHLVRPDGQLVVSSGLVPEEMTRHPEVLRDVVQSGQGFTLPLRLTEDGVVIDILRPVFTLDEAGPGQVQAVLWFTLPVGEKLAELVEATQLDRPGERTAMLQSTPTGAMVVGRTALAPLAEGYDALEKRLGNGRIVQQSVIDGEPVFATLKPVEGTPFALLQEYVARNALEIMELYKPGLYVVVALAVVVLTAMMLALTVHLMAQRNKTRVRLLGQTMDALVRVVEARDPYLSGHHGRVARLCVQVGNVLALDVGERATLFYAAQLGSVGRLMVPRDVLAKKGKLSPAERQKLESHVSQAVGILGDLDFDLPIVPVIAQMYEREDGSGHPAGLKGPDILRMAKVLGACDAFVAMTSDRAHREALSTEEALKIMSGGAFAKDVVSALKRVNG